MRNTCPACQRTFEVSPWDDYFIPAPPCDCYAHLKEGGYLCENCGLAHVYRCPKRGAAQDAPLPSLYEIGGPMGAVVARGRIKEPEKGDQQ